MTLTTALKGCVDLNLNLNLADLTPAVYTTYRHTILKELEGQK